MLRVRYVGDVDARLKPEVNAFARWLRAWYTFPVSLELRLMGVEAIADDDGALCALRWWQCRDGGPVTAELAVGTFTANFDAEGPSVAYPTVLAAVARIAKYYFQVVTGAPVREDFAEAWGDKVLDAYLGDGTPPAPYAGAKLE